MISVFERAKTVHALDGAATAIAGLMSTKSYLHFAFNDHSDVPYELQRVLRGGHNLLSTFQVQEKHRAYEIQRICLLRLQARLKFSTSQCERHL
jgi:hypothetical protein